MTKDEALKLALEALEDLGMKHFESTGEVLYKETFTAIKEALMSVPDGAQPSVRVEQEPVAMDDLPHQDWCRWWKNGDFCTCGADTTPPQRKPLTDEEIGAILEDVNAYGTRLYIFARAIEAAHGIKGEA